MQDDPTFQTATMARLLAQQGKWAQAAGIYRYLLRLQPGESAYRDALAEAQRQSIAAGPRALSPLLAQWIRILLAVQTREQLKRMQLGLHGGRSLERGLP